MAIRSLESFNILTVARQAIGHGNYVLIGEAVVGPIPEDRTDKRGSELLMAGASAISPASEQRITADQAYARLASSLKQTERELLTDMTEARRQSRVFFALLCVFSVAAFCLVLVAGTLVLLGRIQAGVLSAVASAVADLLVLAFSKKDHELRRVIEGYHAHLVSYCQFLKMMDVTETIVDEAERDTLKSRINSSLLNAKPEEKVDALNAKE